jgi:hypothetical protein
VSELDKKAGKRKYCWPFLLTIKTGWAAMEVCPCWANGAPQAGHETPTSDMHSAPPWLLAAAGKAPCFIRGSPDA